MSLGLFFPGFSLIYSYFWRDFWHQSRGNNSRPCAKCGTEWSGAIGKFYYGTKTGEQTSRRRYINTVTTYTSSSYQIDGTEIHYICDVCAKSYRLKDLRNHAYRVLGGMLIPALIAFVLMFIMPKEVAEDMRWIYDGLLILLIISIIGGILSILDGIELIGRIVIHATQKNRGRSLFSEPDKITQFEESLFGNSESTRNTALDYDRDNIAIDMRQHDLGNDYIYWTRATYDKLHPRSF